MKDINYIKAMIAQEGRALAKADDTDARKAIRRRLDSLESDIEEELADRLAGYTQSNPMTEEVVIGDGLAKQTINAMCYDEEEGVLMRWSKECEWLPIDDELTTEQQMEVLDSLT